MYDDVVGDVKGFEDRSGPAGVGRRLLDICGPGFARPAGAADEVAGRQARWVAVPGSAPAVGDVLRLAAEYDLSVVPRGAGTKLDWGASPAQLDILLDTGRLAGVWHRANGELTAEVGAGTPVRAVQAILERFGRRLAVDVRSAEATIGGVVAADESGPLRHRYGSSCAQVTEVSYVDADGSINVVGSRSAEPDSGRELAALLCGSHGALGVLVSATLRVQSMPASRLWVSRSVWTPLEMHDLVGEILADTVAPAAIEVDFPGGRLEGSWQVARGPDGAWQLGHPAGTGHPADASRRRPDGPDPRGPGTLAVLIEGGPSDVAERVARLGRLLGGDASTSTTPPPWWRRYPFGSDDIALRIEVPIGELHAAVYALRDAAGTPMPVRGSAGLGVVYAALPATIVPDRLAGILSVVRRVLQARAGRCVVVAAPPAVRRSVDLWGERTDLPLLRRVKERFDPDHRLAPGRFPGGL